MVPYANATTGYKAREDIAKLLEKFGCQSVGFMDEFDTQSVLLAFTWRGATCSCVPAPNGRIHEEIRQIEATGV